MQVDIFLEQFIYGGTIPVPSQMFILYYIV